MRREKMDHPVEKLTDWETLSLFGERESNERRALRGLLPRREPKQVTPYEDRGVVVDVEKLSVAELVSLENTSLERVKMQLGDKEIHYTGSGIVDVQAMGLEKFIRQEVAENPKYVHHTLPDIENPGPFKKREDPNMKPGTLRAAMREARQTMGTLPMGKVPPKMKRAIAIARKQGKMLDQQAWFIKASAMTSKRKVDPDPVPTEVKPWAPEPRFYRVKDGNPRNWSRNNAVPVY